MLAPPGLSTAHAQPRQSEHQQQLQQQPQRQQHNLRTLLNDEDDDLIGVRRPSATNNQHYHPQHQQSLYPTSIQSRVEDQMRFENRSRYAPQQQQRFTTKHLQSHHPQEKLSPSEHFLRQHGVPVDAVERRQQQQREDEHQRQRRAAAAATTAIGGGGGVQMEDRKAAELQRRRHQYQHAQRWMLQARKHEVGMRQSHRESCSAQFRHLTTAPNSDHPLVGDSFDGAADGGPLVAESTNNFSAAASPSTPRRDSVAHHRLRNQHEHWGFGRAVSEVNYMRPRDHKNAAVAEVRGTFSQSASWYKAPAPRMAHRFEAWKDKPTPGPGTYQLPSSF